MKDCGLAKGSKCHYKHIFGCHLSRCSMNFYRKNATLGEIPWVVLIGIFKKGGYQAACTGSIVNERWILTAAHCFNTTDLSYVRVFVGDVGPYGMLPNGGYEVKQIKMHPEFGTPTKWCHDMALLELTQPITFGPNACSVCLPPPFHEHGEKETALFAGYGVYDMPKSIRLQTS